MLNWLIDFSLRHRFWVIAAVAVCAVAGVYSLTRIDIDAFPDTTPVQVQINTTAPSLSPEEVEQQITFPIEQKISGLAHLDQVRSLSQFGLSQVVVTFDDDTNIYFARQLISERLGTVELPLGIARPTLGPVATGLGEVLHYTLTYKGYDFSTLPEEERIQKLTELRTLHDWVIRPKLRTVRGVAEINSWGGYEKQYQVRIDPKRLIKHALTFDQVVEALEKNNRNVGGGNITQNSQMLLVQGIARTVNVEQIKAMVVTAKDGIPIGIGDVADVEVGHEIRRGAVTANGKGEVVHGLGFMLMGENSHIVTRELKKKLEEIKETLPRDVELTTVYDRTELVDFVMDTARQNLFEGGLLVIAVLFLFLGNLRAAAIVALAIPLSMLFAFSGMLRFGIAASLLSLGAIDFGMVVDSSVVMVENCVRHIGHGDTRRRLLDVIRDAAVEVRKPTMFGELIIMIVYLPILTLEGIEGKLFRPMALTVILALAGSMILSMTLMPVLASLMLPDGTERRTPLRVVLFNVVAVILVFGGAFTLLAKALVPVAVWRSTDFWMLVLLLAVLVVSLWLSRAREEREPLPMRLAKWLYAPMLRFTMQNKLAVVVVALGVLAVVFGMIAPNLGTEFVPRLSEGAIVIGVVRLSGTSLDEALRMNTQMEKAILAAFPDEVRHVWSRTGTAEVATDPMGIWLTDVFISLLPRSHWTKAHTQEELANLLDKEIRSLPGQRYGISQPIEQRSNEMISGVRSDLGVKLFGDNLEVLKAKGIVIKEWLEKIPGAADVNLKQITGQPVLRIEVKQDQLARYGLPAKAVLDLVESLGGKPMGEVVEGQLRFPLVIRLPDMLRAKQELIGTIELPTPSGERIPLERLANIQQIEGPSTIEREWGQRRAVVTCNIRGRDMGSFVAEAQRLINADTLKLRGRYHLEWGGQFENYQRARDRLLLVIPLAVLLIFGLLFLTYQNVIDSLRVFTGVPLGWVGGIIALWLRDMPFSISAAVGFIAMSGVAVLDDMILVSYIRQLRRKGMSADRAVSEAAITRLRPVLMTTLVASLGFVPMALSTGMGAEVQRPLATVVIGGVISAMVMSLLVIRVLYLLFDSAANSFVWIADRWFGIHVDQLGWLIGEFREEKGEGIKVESPDRKAISASETVEEVHV